MCTYVSILVASNNFLFSLLESLDSLVSWFTIELRFVKKE